MPTKDAATPDDYDTGRGYPQRLVQAAQSPRGQRLGTLLLAISVGLCVALSPLPANLVGIAALITLVTTTRR